MSLRAVTGARPVQAVETDGALSEVSSIPLDLFHLTAPRGASLDGATAYQGRRLGPGRVELRSCAFFTASSSAYLSGRTAESSLRLCSRSSRRCASRSASPTRCRGGSTSPRRGEALTEGAFWKKEGPKHQRVTPEEAIARGKVNVKHDLLRCFQIPVQALRLLYDLDATDTAGVVEELVHRGLIDPTFAKKLRAAFDGIQKMRIENHLATGKPEDRLTALTDERVKTIQRAIPVLYRLRQELRTLDRVDPNHFDLR